MESLREGNRVLLGQAIRLMEGMTDEGYTRPCAACFDSSPGGHMRHLLEHYGNFLSGLGTGEIDYERRDRHSAVGTRREAALEMAMQLFGRFSRMERPAGSGLVVMSHEAGSPPCKSVTSLERELEFLLSHKVHHFALIRTILWIRGWRHFPEGFGVAPSTLRYQQGGGREPAATGEHP